MHLTNTEDRTEHNGSVHYLYLDLNGAYNSVQKEESCNILNELNTPMQLLTLGPLRTFRKHGHFYLFSTVHEWKRSMDK
jgi:hypothetical protein